MAVYSDSPGYAATVLPDEVGRRLKRAGDPDPGIHPMLSRLISGTSPLYRAAWPELPFTFLISEYSPTSQYDALIGMARDGDDLPDRMACLAGSGRGFHGFKGRAWAALPGNIHLSVHLAPNRSVERFHVAFTALAALSVVEAVNGLGGLPVKPKIKWVNDVLMEGAKVAGVLAYTQSRDTTVTSAILGIGLNVEVAPQIEPTPFVPGVAAVRDFLPNGPPDVQARVLLSLLEALEQNYRTLLSEGADPILQRYGEHSAVVGEEVVVCSEASDRSLRVIAHGRVERFGENLELFLDSRASPITTGRLVLGSMENEEEGWAPWVAQATLGPNPPKRCIHTR